MKIQNINASKMKVKYILRTKIWVSWHKWYYGILASITEKYLNKNYKTNF